ncbi:MULTISPECIES: stage II sporulation protein E [Clostridium]|uniref:stage II sporulation protein E n=1 Tax=Clostridium TaxID=1485 RepID=UPI00069D0AF1|nr:MULTISPECIES: stage II sporulation protein E [Clostridium]KOF56205.1 stage II sporulation protein E [Clostridium sp. DMHC 10]MCD2347879.1 stage II sporulation protein E [Clostridium guangxiense]
MQYDSNVLTYERVAKENKKDTKVNNVNKIFMIKLILFAVSSFFISRVVIVDSMAPFGIAFTIVILNFKFDKKIDTVSCISSALGYISIHSELKDFHMYVISILIMGVISFTLSKITKIKKLIFMFSTIFIEFTIFKFLILNLTIESAILFSLIQVACTVSLYYILNYCIICFDNINSRHLFSNEEIISMAITISIAISGTKGTELFGVSIRNTLSMLFILILAYVSGSAVGAASGIALGAIVGMNTDNMLVYISVFGIAALIVGIFKESGKLVSGASYVIILCILILYCKDHGDLNFIEVFLTSAAFVIIPDKVYERIRSEISWDKKQEIINDNYIEKIKNIFVNRLDSFSEVLFTMSNILNNLADNDKLALKTKSCGLIENLADRVCGSCNMRSICWKRETYYTYAGFEELIQNYQNNIFKIPKEIEKKCIKRTALIKNTEDIVNNYIISEMWRMQLSKGREIMSSQINNMGGSIKEILSEFKSELKIDSDMERKLIKALSKNNVEFKDLICLTSKNDKLMIKMTMPACGGRQICVKDVLPIINRSVEKIMCVGDDGCSISPENNLCTVIFEETPKYYIASYVSRVCKNGEKQNGDSYSFGKTKDGNYMMIISDGMGYGPQAQRESKAVVDLIEKFTMAGLNQNTAINAVNSIMTLKFNEDEKFSTVDLCKVDLYSGNADFLKVGGVNSFIKRKNKVQVINSKTLPIGVLDKADIQITSKNVQNGDVIVMISDGVMDCKKEDTGEAKWIVDFLSKCDGSKPKELADVIINKALEFCNGKAEDDMTVIVNKVYNLY